MLLNCSQNTSATVSTKLNLKLKKNTSGNILLKNFPFRSSEAFFP